MAQLEEVRLAQSATPKETQLGISSTRQFTLRELQIAALVAKGYTNAKIGAQPWITQNSVKQALKFFSG